MGTKFRGIVVPSDNPGIRTTFESIPPLAPMYLVEVSRHVLGVGFLHMTPSQEEYDRIGCVLSRVAGQAAFYWCHSAIGDGYTLYEQGNAVRCHYDEFAPLGALPFYGATYAELQEAFCHPAAMVARNVPSLTSVVERFDVRDFRPSMRGRKGSLLKKAEVFGRLIESGDNDAALKALGDDLIVSAGDWLCTSSAVLVATVKSLLDVSLSGQET
jgi:hypothetical protein